MSNYGQQPPYGQNPYGPPPQQPNPYGAPQQPYGQPGQPRPPQPPYGAPQGQPYAPPPPYPPPAYGQPGQPGQPGSAQSAPAYGQPGQWTPQPPAERKPAIVSHALPVVTMDTVPGQQISEVVGDVVGVVARARELRPDLRGGNVIEGYVTMLTESRQDAVTRLVAMAQSAGADAVVGLRFDCSEITQSLSEVAAYGTAVKFVATAAPDASNDESDVTDETDRDDETTPRNGQPPSGGPDAAQQWPPSSWPSSS
jgi:uncharacterized protein YbjQ (UPF0145 family)